MAVVSAIVSTIAGAASAAAGAIGLGNLALGALVVGGSIVSQAKAKDAAQSAQQQAKNQAQKAAQKAAAAAKQQAESAKAAALKAAAARKAANIALALTAQQDFVEPFQLSTATLELGQQANFRSPVAFHRTIYGRTKTGGPIVFINGTGSQNQFLHLIIILAAHECDAVESIFIDQDELELDENGDSTGKYAGHVRIKVHLGQSDQAVDPDLIAENPDFVENTDRFRGRTYLYVRLKYDPPNFDGQGNLTDIGLFPNFIPDISAVIRGKRVFDPRTNLISWTANAALCAADYLETGPLSIPRALINQADLIAAANICDQPVDLHNNPGETQARYTTNGQFLSNETAENVLADFGGAMAGAITHVGGEFSIRPGAWSVPVVDITAGDIYNGFALSLNEPLRTVANTIKGIYIDPANHYQFSDYPFVVDDTARLRDGEAHIIEIDLPFTNSSAAAQRLAKIHLAASRFEESLTLIVDIRKGFQLRPDDIITLSLDFLDLSGAYFRVASWKLQFAGGGLVCELELTQTDPTIYDWTPSQDEKPIDTESQTNLPNNIFSPNLDLSSLEVERINERTISGADAWDLELSWADTVTPASDDVEEVEFRHRYKVQQGGLDSVWTAWSAIVTEDLDNSPATIVDAYVTWRDLWLGDNTWTLLNAEQIQVRTRSGNKAVGVWQTKSFDTSV